MLKLYHEDDIFLWVLLNNSISPCPIPYNADQFKTPAL